MPGAIPGFRVLLTMTIHPGMEASFEREWAAVASAVTEHPANLGHWLMRSAGEDSDAGAVYLIGSDWTDEPSFRGFEDSAVHLEHRQRLHPYRATGRISLMTVLSHKTGAGARAAEGAGVR